MKEFEKIIGYANVKNELEKICDIIINNEKYSKLGVTTPHGLLLYGDPGVGKTLMANCFIEATKRKTYVCRKDKPDGDFIREIKRSFDEAKANAPSIVFLDDMDKFANQDNAHRNAEEYVTIQSCIDDCKGLEVFVIATVNEYDLLPSSLLRAGRFDKKIQINKPKGKDAVEIMKYYLRQKSFVEELDIEELAKVINGRSCAELETLVNEAGVYAGYQNKEKIDLDDMIDACMRVIFKAPENLEEVNEEILLQIAYHEAGHMVIAELIEPGSVSLVSVRNYDSPTGGITAYYQDEKYFYQRKYMENRVKALLAGKAVTEIVYGDVDVGAGGDIKRAFDIVARFVDDYCSTSFDRFAFGRPDSNDLRSRKEMQISFEIEKYYAEVKKILIQNRAFVDAIAKALVDKKTLIGKDIKAIKENLKIAC